MGFVVFALCCLYLGLIDFYIVVLILWFDFGLCLLGMFGCCGCFGWFVVLGLVYLVNLVVSFSVFLRFIDLWVCFMFVPEALISRLECFRVTEFVLFHSSYDGFPGFADFFGLLIFGLLIFGFWVFYVCWSFVCSVLGLLYCRFFFVIFCVLGFGLGFVFR